MHNDASTSSKGTWGSGEGGERGGNRAGRGEVRGDRAGRQESPCLVVRGVSTSLTSVRLYQWHGGSWGVGCKPACVGLAVSCSSRPFLLGCCLPVLSLTGFTSLLLTQHAGRCGLKASITQPHLRIHTQGSSPAMMFHKPGMPVKTACKGQMHVLDCTTSKVQKRLLCVLAKLLPCCMCLVVQTS